MDHGTGCLICSSAADALTLESGKKYSFCPECEFISIDKRFRISEKEARLRYLRHNNSSSNKGYVDMLRGLAGYITEHMPGEGRCVLDFGCGPVPVLGEILESKGFTVSIFDPLFFSNDDFTGKEYDAVILNEVIEHLESPHAVLSDLKRLLAPGGCFVFSSLLHSGSEDDFRNWWYKEDVTHISFFSERTVDVLARRIKMKKLHCDGRSRWVYVR